jgi:integrase
VCVHSDGRLEKTLYVLKETGARSGEAARLKWSDVDFERKIARITPKKDNVTETDGSKLFKKRK